MKSLIVEDGGAAIHTAEANGLIVLRDWPLPDPDFAPGLRVESGRAIRGSDVHDAVDNEGRGLIATAGELVGPLHFEPGDIDCIDFGQRRVAVPLQVPGVGEPVARFPAGIADALEGNLRDGGEADGDEREFIRSP